MIGDTAARIAIMGYSSLDHAMQLESFNGIDATSIVRGRLSSTWPAIGGIAHIARAAARVAGADVTAVSWVGNDSFGDLWTSAVSDSGASIAGVRRDGLRSPSSYLAYIDGGGTICLFDPADCHDGGLSEEQTRLLLEAEWCLVTVGPAAATRELLSILPAGAKLVWAVKQDRDAFPPDLASDLLARADVVSFSAGERSFVTFDGRGPEEYCRPGTLVVETRGSQGVTFSFASPDGPLRTGIVATEALDGADTTGAGDTFVGTLVAALASANGGRDDGDVTPEIGRAVSACTNLIRSRIPAASRSSAASHS